MADDNLMAAALAAILSMALAANALLLHGEQRKVHLRRRNWLIQGARNLALAPDSEWNSEQQSRYSIEEPVGRADLRQLLPAAFIFTCVTAIIAFAVAWSGSTPVHPVWATASGESALAFPFRVYLFEILLCTFIPAYFSANVLIFLAAVRGGLETSSFVQATAAQFLTVLFALVLLVVTIGFLQPVRDNVLFHAVVVNVKLANIAIALAPALWVVANARRAAHDLAGIEGLAYRDRLILSGYEVKNISNLATTNPGSLYVISKFDVYRLADWMGQAQLMNRFPHEYRQLRNLGLRTIFDLVVILDSPARSRVIDVLHGHLGEFTRTHDFDSEQRSSREELAYIELDRIRSDPSYRALIHFRRIADSVQTRSVESLPAVLSSVLEKSVASAVTHAMFGEPPIRYRGKVRLNVTLRAEQRASDGKAQYEATVEFAPSTEGGPGWTALDIWEGRHEPEVPFRVRFDSDAEDFESVESAVNVALDRSAEARNYIELPRSCQAYLWATIIQSDRTVQVLEITVPAPVPEAD